MLAPGIRRTIGWETLDFRSSCRWLLRRNYVRRLFCTSQSKPLMRLVARRVLEFDASFRFKVRGEDLDESPQASTYNPRALPERTIREAQVLEFGPVTFPGL
jgi:hypothetical protein